MRMTWVLAVITSILVYTLCAVPQVRSEEITCDGIDTAELNKMIENGLGYIVRQQKPDGHWDAQGQYPLTMTGLCGMALLMEGSTIREGKYADNIRKAVDWLLAPGRPQPNGLLCNMNMPGEQGRYMYGHGFAQMFLASVYGEEEDADRRKRLEEVLVKAAKFSRDAQTSRGGYGYVSAKDGGNFDEGSCTVPQVQAVRACRNAGISVDPNLIKDAMKYLHDCTNPQGGVVYSLGGGGGGDGRPALTAAAICCGFCCGTYGTDEKNPYSQDLKKWIKFVQGQPGLFQGGGGRFGHDEYTHYYFGQCVYFLGEDGYEKIFPNCKESEKLTWSGYKKQTFKNLLNSQNKGDGSWAGAQVGPIFCTACYLSLLQMDKAVLPLYQR